MFLDPSELKTTMYEYQVNQIVENDSTIVISAINTAIDEVKSYLMPNNQSEWRDGRPLYDVEAIFSETGEDRNALILAHTKTVAQWWILDLSNVDILHEQVKERYDRSIEYLQKVNNGEVTVHGLPTLDPTEDNIANRQPFRMGSRNKFNHTY